MALKAKAAADAAGASRPPSKSLLLAEWLTAVRASPWIPRRKSTTPPTAIRTWCPTSPAPRDAGRRAEGLRRRLPASRQAVLPSGQRPCSHSDNVMRRFIRVVDVAGVPRIWLHDVRHTYATVALDNGDDLKVVSDRLGHANVTVTTQIYAHRSVGKNRQSADRIASLILQRVLGGAGLKKALATDLPTPDARMAPQVIPEGPFPLVAGTGFEPAASGL
ncbi:tyrosine-type recombinase/integrase [Dactylosporangium sp. CA-139114]|uniref:tyrosine-type recombinase/integrase n=1 Tax=Dactylosporangium sp. CA-139114 TaxID=3239931 RepID=UPI003D97B935